METMEYSARSFERVGAFVLLFTFKMTLLSVLSAIAGMHKWKSTCGTVHSLSTLTFVGLTRHLVRRFRTSLAIVSLCFCFLFC